MTQADELTTKERSTTVDRAHDDVVFPPENLDQLLDLARFMEGHTEPGLLLGPGGEQISLPTEVYQVLRHVVEDMRGGKAITIAPKGLLLTTQEAADFLGISRPTLVKLLENGTIPFDKPNRHRRVLLRDLLAFQERRRAERRATLNQLTEEAAELGLYDESPEKYAAALKSARRRRAS
jgi:excisionase family DNA binding protein